jgi:Ca-activated chloride channel family protein
MRERWVICSLFLFVLFSHARRIDSQTNSAVPYSLSVAVDEVVLTFHASDSHGLSINDLKLDELRLSDNGKPPRRILTFQLLQDFPIRAGIVMDASASMWDDLPVTRAISLKYARSLLRQRTDQAFVMNFGSVSRTLQPWSNDPVALAAGIGKVIPGKDSRIGATTAIFDVIYGVCRYQFGKIDHAASGNFILLFSDGEDNGSYLPIKEAVDMCQHTNTAIYAFRTKTESSGFQTLSELASETGGRVFRASASEAEIYDDLQIIEADLRNQYRLIYKPSELKHDGAFHRIELTAPERVDSVTIRSGYYAPSRRADPLP